MAVSAEDVQKLRQMTGAGMMDCKKALVETNGDTEKAVEFLRKKGMASAAKRAGREVHAGIIMSYIHPGAQLGVMVEVNCETDFVAKTEDFQEFAKDIAMQIAASNPIGVNREDIPQKSIEKELEIYKTQALEQGKPEQVVEKIATGKLDKYFSEVALMEQHFVKDQNKTIKEHMLEISGKLGENISIRRFVRFQLGE